MNADSSDPCPLCGGLKWVLTPQFRRPVPCPCTGMRELITRIQQQTGDILNVDGIPARDYTLDDFLALPDATMHHKHLAIEAACQWVRTPRAGVLCLSGPSGVGKTTLALAALYILADTDPVFALDATHLFMSIADGYREDSASERLNTLERVPALLVDDLGRVGHSIASEHVSRVLHAILSARSDFSRPTIITTNLNADQFARQFDRTAADRVRRWARGLPGVPEDGFVPMGGETL